MNKMSLSINKIPLYIEKHKPEITKSMKVSSYLLDCRQKQSNFYKSATNKNNLK